MCFIDKLLRFSDRFLTVIANVCGHIEDKAVAESLEHRRDLREVFLILLLFLLFLEAQRKRNVRVIGVIIRVASTAVI